MMFMSVSSKELYALIKGHATQPSDYLRLGEATTDSGRKSTWVWSTIYVILVPEEFTLAGRSAML